MYGENPCPNAQDPPDSATPEPPDAAPAHKPPDAEPTAPEHPVVPLAPERPVVPPAPERSVVPRAPDRSVVPPAPEPLFLPGLGALVVDTGRGDRVGEFRGVAGPYWSLRPVGGGTEWEAEPQRVRPALLMEQLRARTARLNARSRGEVL